MNIRGRPASHLLARGAIKAAAWHDRAMTMMCQRFPSWLGLPVLGPYVQLYRQDKDFSTEVSVFNYLSTFMPGIEHHIDFRIVCMDRHGRKIGSGVIGVAPGGTAQKRLNDIVAGGLDEYGLFHVMAKPRSQDAETVASIGETTGQFMTLFCPVSTATAAPQILHSHKLFQRFPILRSPINRSPHLSEDVATLDLLSFYVLNPQPMRLSFGLTVRECATGTRLLTQSVQVAGHGVGVVRMDRAVMSDWENPVCFEYAFDRQVSHRKPILFRRYPGGVITCNHT